MPMRTRGGETIRPGGRPPGEPPSGGRRSGCAALDRRPLEQRSMLGDGAQPVRRIERGDLVRLGEGRVVEDRLDQVVDRAAEAHHRLADVDELRRPGAEGVYAEER